MAFVESGQRITLQPQVVQDDQGSVTISTSQFVVTSDRYEIELASPDGLRNPHPGRSPVVALPDAAPVGRLLSPPEDSLDVVLPNGLLFLRVEGDDFAVERIDAQVQLSKRDATARIGLTPAPTRRGRWWRSRSSRCAPARAGREPAGR